MIEHYFGQELPQTEHTFHLTVSVVTRVLTLSHGKLFVDNAEQSVPVNVPAHSKVRVILRAPTTGKMAFSTLVTDKDTHVFALYANARQMVYDRSLSSFPHQFDFVAAEQNRPYTVSDAKLIQLDGMNWARSTQLKNTQASSYPQTTQTFVAVRSHNMVYRVDTDALTVQQAFPVNKPVAAARLPKPSELGDVYFYYFVSETGKVYEANALDKYSLTQVHTTQECHDALGLDGLLWLACRNTVEIVNLGADTTIIDLGARCAQMVANDTHVFVSLFFDNKVAAIDRSTHEVQMIAVGYRPYAMAFDDQLLVCGINNVTRVDLSDFSTTIRDINTQLSCAIGVRNSEILIADSEQRQLVRYDRNFKRVDALPLSRPLAFDFGEQSFVLVGESVAGSSLVVANRVPDAFEFEAITNAPVSAQRETNSITVHGINVTTQISLDPESNSALIIDGKNVGKYGFVDDGSSVRVQIETSADYGALSLAYLYIGGTVKQISAVTTEIDLVPDSIRFEPARVHESSTVVSNIQTIRGLTPEHSVPAYAENGTLLINGEVADESATVKNGDTVALQQQATVNSFSTAFLVIDPLRVPFSVNAFENDLDILTLASVEDWPLNTEAKSEVFHVNVATQLTVSNNYRSAIYVNGQNRGRSVAVRPADNIQLAMTTTRASFLDHIVTLNSEHHSVLWIVTTKPDLSPVYVAFSAVTDAKVRTQYTTNTVALSGMSNGADARATVVPACTVLHNGVELNADQSATSFDFVVRNGDTIALRALSPNIYGETRSYTLEIGGMRTRFIIHASALNGAFENPCVSHQAQISSFERRVTSRTATKTTWLAENTHNQILKQAEFENKKFAITTLLSKAKAQTRFTSRPIANHADAVRRRARQLPVNAQTPVKRSVRRFDVNALVSDLRKRNLRLLAAYDADSSGGVSYLIVAHTVQVFRRTTNVAHNLKAQVLQSTQIEHNGLDFALCVGESWYADLFGYESPKSSHVFADSMTATRIGIDRAAVQTPAFVTHSKVHNTVERPTYDQISNTYRDTFIFGFDQFSNTYRDTSIFGFNQNPNIFRTVQPLGAQYLAHGFRDVSIFGFDQSPNVLRTVQPLDAVRIDYSDTSRYVSAQFDYMNLNHETTRETPIYGFDYNDIEFRTSIAVDASFGYDFGRSNREINEFYFGASLSEPTRDFNFDPIAGISQVGTTALLQPIAGQSMEHTAVGVEPGYPYTKIGSSREVERKGSTAKHTSAIVSQSKRTSQPTFTSRSVVPKRDPERNSNETFETDRQLVNAVELGYFASQEQAFLDAVSLGIERTRIQTFELRPGEWIWAELVDQPDLCAPIDPDAVSGWIKGG